MSGEGVDLPGVNPCGSCGAAVGVDAGWCGQCFAPQPAAATTTVFSPGTTHAATANPPVFSPGLATAAAPAPAVFSPGRTAAAPTGFGPPPPSGPPGSAAPVKRTRWQKTPTTFGPLGRVSLTVALVVPLALMIVGGLADPFVWGGAGFWGVVVMPWALKDIWKSGLIRLS
jgi:hypothetical protein